MKLKNSCILLIAIALFLLVSVGSVCASDNAADALATQIDDDGSDVIAIDNADDSTIISEGETGDTPDNGTEPGDDAGNGTETEKINTTVTSNDVEVGENDPVEIPVAVKDNESNNIAISKENITVTENNKTINFNYNNSIINITDKLSVGNHSLIINYLGNELYKNSTTSIILSISGNITLDAPSIVTTDGETVEIPLTISDGVREYVVDASKLTLNLTYVDENGNTTSRLIDAFNIENNTVRFLLDDLKFVSAYVNVSYTDGATSSKKVALKYATQVNAENAKFNATDNKTVAVVVLSGDKILNITKSNLKVLENNKDIAFDYNNSTITIKSLTTGNHTIIIKYLGNDTFGESNKTILISVYGNVTINADKSINVNSSKHGEVTIKNITNSVDTFNFTLDDLNFTVTYKDGNDTKTVAINVTKLENGTISFELENLNFTTATLTITYNNTVSTNVTVNRIYNAIIEIVDNENEYKTGTFKFRLVDVDNNNATIPNVKLSLYTTGNIRAGFSTTTDSEGIGSFKTANLYTFDNTNGTLSMQELKVGKYLVELSTEGSIKSTKVSTNLTVVKATISITIDNFAEEYQTKKNVTITVKNSEGEAMTGIIIHLYMPKTTGKNYYFITGTDGKSKISVTNLIPGTYALTVSNNDTANINKKSVSKSITIKKIGVKIVAKNSCQNFNTGTTSIIKVVNAKTGKAVPNAIIKVKLYTTSTKYKILRFQADSKGVVKFSASLGVGKHKIVIGMAENKYEPRYAASSVTKYITVNKATAKIVAPKVKAYYKQGKYFSVKLVNTKKNNQPIYDAKLDITIYAATRYYHYAGNTGGNGEIKLAITLAPGTYKVVIKGADTKNFACNPVTSQFTVVKAPTKITPTEVTVKKGTANYFTAKMVNTKTKKAVSGVKITFKVYTGKTYKTFSATTNSQGIAKISTKALAVGLHKVIVASGNKYCTANDATSYIRVTK